MTAKAHFTEERKNEARALLEEAMGPIQNESFIKYLMGGLVHEAEAETIAVADKLMPAVARLPPQAGIRALAYILATTFMVKGGNLDQFKALATATWFQVERRMLYENGNIPPQNPATSWAEPTDGNE